jgi:hypothetical protein
MLAAIAWIPVPSPLRTATGSDGRAVWITMAGPHIANADDGSMMCARNDEALFRNALRWPCLRLCLSLSASSRVCGWPRVHFPSTDRRCRRRIGLLPWQPPSAGMRERGPRRPCTEHQNWIAGLILEGLSKRRSTSSSGPRLGAATVRIEVEKMAWKFDYSHEMNGCAVRRTTSRTWHAILGLRTSKATVGCPRAERPTSWRHGRVSRSVAPDCTSRLPGSR